ncbi:PadR family transcriptional regulator [Shinella sp. CPCC 101442]|uniref:PadR family transcriptional regulator n=1 Tax=Shinella sp. CPCC 101442 TaxID=2932265 RepID=UPI002152B7B7|nr:PadR family transcriptional regulator [Shinella sp. CPCC 101442]MCR6502195.1 PadR family transcriptional regulator [Shinella sp. CPCC 101442]
MGCGPHRHFSPPDDRSGPFHRGRHHGPGRGGRHGGRLFDYGELRLLLLAIISDAPSHGYELIKTVEERFGGSYSPSPGVIYPTLSWLDDMGYAVIEPAEGGRKRYSITQEGKAFLAANRAAIDELMARAGGGGPGGREGVPAPVVRAMENLKLALRLRLRRGDLDATSAEAIAAALDLAAQTVEKN